MSDHTFNETVESLFKGMDNFLTTKTVVGEAIHANDTLILPLVDVSFGVGAGAWSQEHKNSAGGGMGGKMTPSAVLVIKDGSVRMVPVNNNDPVSKIIDMAPDVIVVVAFGQILPKEVLDIPKLGCVNVHASLLPKFRGAAPIQWAIIDGEKVTGVTTMLMDVGLDTGDMLLKTEVSVDAKETGGSLHDKLAAAGGELLERTLIGLEAGTIVPEKQDDSQAGEYARMLDKELGRIDFNQPAVVVERLIRGLNPWPSAYTYIDGKTLKIWEAEVFDRNYGCEYGEVAEVTRNSLIIQTGIGALSVKSVQLEGKKRMDISAFLNGYTIEKGTRMDFENETNE